MQFLLFLLCQTLPQLLTAVMRKSVAALKIIQLDLLHAEEALLKVLCSCHKSCSLNIQFFLLRLLVKYHK